jgi:hypothetical protein
MSAGDTGRQQNDFKAIKSLNRVTAIAPKSGRGPVQKAKKLDAWPDE